MAFYPMAHSKEDAVTIAASLAAGDFALMHRMGEADRALFVTNGTNVQILEVDGSLARIRVSSGPLLNRSGWLPIDVTSQPR